VIQEKKKFWLIVCVLLFMVYFIMAGRPVPPETVLTPRWFYSLESAYPAVPGGAAGDWLPFTLNNRFGFVNEEGRFSINRIRTGALAIAENRWAEYGTEPERIAVRTALDETAGTIENPGGYPFFLDGRTFILGNEQNALSEIDGSGTIRWTYEFGAPLTCMDAAAGLVLTGSLDGAVELLDGEGNRMLIFEPGGSRYPVILGCAISGDGSRLGIVSGIDEQRFLLLERFGSGAGAYKVIYHEFLGDGFRRQVRIAFIDGGRRLVFEREGGIGLYEISSMKGVKVSLPGELVALDQEGGGGLCFVITALPEGRKLLTAIQFPGSVFMRFPFTSEDVFLGRRDSRLFVGGGMTMALFELEKK
jgi:hypothetical protein